MEHLPWTEDGLILLRTIQLEIERAGGIESMHEAVYNELNASNNERDKIHMDMQIRKMLRYNIGCQKAADILGISYPIYCEKLKDYNKRKNLNK